MGSYFSGNRERRYWRKTTVEESVCLDTRELARQGVLEANILTSGEWHCGYRGFQGVSLNYDVDTREGQNPTIRLLYRVTWFGVVDVSSPDYLVHLKMPGSGWDWWFHCPLLRKGVPCFRQVRKLYLPPRARYFGCRECHNLAYASSQRTHDKPFRMPRRLLPGPKWEEPLAKELLKLMRKERRR